MIKYCLAIKSSDLFSNVVHNLYKVRGARCEDTYNFFPQAPLGAVSSAAEESEGKLIAELMSGAAFILKLTTSDLASTHLALISPSWRFPGLHCTRWSSTFSSSHLRGNIGPAYNIGLLQHHPSPGQRLALHHGGLRLAGVAPLPVLLVPGAGLLLLLNYFSVLINLPFILSQSIKN